MGQMVSAPLTDAVTRVRDGVLRRTAPLQEVTTIPYDQLLQHVDELNTLCAHLRDESGKRLRFRVDESSAVSPVFWRGTVRVVCEKVSAADEPEGSRPLTLPRLLDQLDADDGCCCICLERAPDASLPCAHAYCTVCIEQWNPTHKTCPMCRQGVDSTDEAWVMADAPGGSQLRQDVVSGVMRLATDDR
ncbi:RING finger protein 141-like [Pollicipes pollicipes]|uniref:RING finger protein 141-like n=1 Tax=Pollicipes pollicipes TaxID=41117 RepID=UPI0018852E74|nr:RING finger protein 141-like [Pollicipes pollicipes]